MKADPAVRRTGPEQRSLVIRRTIQLGAGSVLREQRRALRDTPACRVQRPYGIEALVVYLAGRSELRPELGSLCRHEGREVNRLADECAHQRGEGGLEVAAPLRVLCK